MNSVTMVRKFRRNRSPTLNQPQNRAEPLVDQPGVADAGHGAEPDHHLLVDDQHRDQQQQRPQQAGVVVLPGLGVGGDAAGVVVADHHDDAGPDDGAGSPAGGASRWRRRRRRPDPAERALDVAEVRLVEHGGGPGLELAVGGVPGRVDSAAPEPSLPLAAGRSVTGYPLGSGGRSADGLRLRSAGGASGWAWAVSRRRQSSGMRDLQDVVDGDHAEELVVRATTGTVIRL